MNAESCSPVVNSLVDDAVRKIVSRLSDDPLFQVIDVIYSSRCACDIKQFRKYVNKTCRTRPSVDFLLRGRFRISDVAALNQPFNIDQHVRGNTASHQTMTSVSLRIYSVDCFSLDIPA